MKNSYAGSETRPWPFSWIVMGAILVAIMIGSIPLLTDTSNLASAILAPLFAALGVLVEIRRRGARIGWLLIFIGAAIILGTYATVMVSAIETPPLSTTPGMFILLLVADTSWIAVVLPIIILLYVFPTGRLPSLRWRWMPWVGLGATAALLASEAFGPEIGPWDSWQIANPAGFGPPAAIEAIGNAGFLGVLVMTIGGIVAMTLRYRRSSYVGKTQIKLVLTPVALFAIFFVALIMTDFSPTATSAFTFLTTVAGVGIPVSITIAIVRHSLFDIDIVISKTVTYGVLAIFITAVYAIVVVGIGTLLGGGDEPSLALSIVAVAIVAVAFEPVRNRLQRWANRLVFGERATPYQVLSQATARLAGAGSPEEALKQVTQLVVDGAGASEAILWLKVGANLQPRSATPIEALIELADVSITGGDLPDLPGEQSVLIRHRGDILGALTISKARGESVNAIDESMLNDVAAGTGLLLRNISLNAELTERAEQLRVSRRRLVATHDAERHRLERDLHDGAQQQVVAIKVKLGIARALAEREDASEVETLVLSLAEATQEAVDAMRAVAHGIYPPLLEAEGLGVALTAASRTTSIPIEIEMTSFGRYERAVEESLYFCILETVAHAIDGGATWVRVEVTESPDAVRFTVHHDGTIDTLLAVEDRVAAFGGRVTLASTPAERVVTAELPNIDALAVTV